MRLGCLPWLIAIAMIVGGGQSLYTGFTNRKLTEVKISEFDSAKEDAKWLKITGGELDVTNFSYTSILGGSPNEVYIPLVAPGVDSMEEPIHILYKTKDEAILETVRELVKIDDSDEKDPMKVIAAIGQLGKEKLRPQRDIEGLVQYGIDSNKKDEKVRDLYDNLVKESVVIKDGEQPSMFVGLALLVGGLGVAGFMAKGLGAKEVSGPPAIPQS